MSYRPSRRLLFAAAVASATTILITELAGGQAPRLERVTEIGCEDCGDARQLASTWDVSTNEAGDVLVADRDAPTLRMFDKTGRLLWTVGRPGAGPGEYRYTIRAALGPNGSVHVVDMHLRRLTRLAPDRTVARSLTVPFFTAGVSARGRLGELIVLTDDFKGGGTLQRWLSTADTPVQVAAVALPTPGAATHSPSVAIAPNGDIAYIGSGDRYEIQRLSASGQPLPSIVRDVPRPRRSAEEIAAMKSRMNMVGAAAKSTAERKESGTSKSLLADEDRFAFKPHAATDGLRYDDSGRLWLRTMRGAGRTTVFDVFSPIGAFVGEVKAPIPVTTFSLAGSYLATASEREDGVPVVVLWMVK